MLDGEVTEPHTPVEVLTPLLSKQVWLLLGHSQASPSHPSVQAQRPIKHEPRSEGVKGRHV